ncbi:glycosyl hydrolase [Klebsormidium nitens]|uniref:Glycosyl hydrolase n=1 Tax=Klebsormidium nitens TaxID=105231 RepID=A0A1Y1I1L3_KLENI|nr:glycosyl hydrolase [Klebsormidium nitens]|eukprot:GAQ84800.1 glycosyl hydrolase [Klebsormidium nitens]
MGGCRLQIFSATPGPFIQPQSGRNYLVVTGRTQEWEGISQHLQFEKSVPHLIYAWVRVANAPTATVTATLSIGQAPNVRYIPVGKVVASCNEWVQLVGSLQLEAADPPLGNLYFSGAPPGVDILLNNVYVLRDTLIEQVLSSAQPQSGPYNVLRNSDFSEGAFWWFPAGACQTQVFAGSAQVSPKSGAFFLCTYQRTNPWEGPAQMLTGKLRAGLEYRLSASVRVGNAPSAQVKASLRVEYGQRSSFVYVGAVTASDQNWTDLKGAFTLDEVPSRSHLYFEGPAAGVDILLDQVELAPADVTRHCRQSAATTGVNLVQNPDFQRGTDCWMPFGVTFELVQTGPLLPPGGGPYLRAWNRSATWQGPAQSFGGSTIRPGAEYEVKALLRVAGASCAPLQMAARITFTDGKQDYHFCGDFEATDDAWAELAGTLSLDRPAKEVLLYVQSAPAGVDILLARMSLVEVDLAQHRQQLAEQTDKLRRQDVELVLSDESGSPLAGARIEVNQVKRSFPFGCVSGPRNVQNKVWEAYFLKTFNWTVFENEMKWYHTEGQRGQLNYRDADALMAWADKHALKVRGHCIFWEVEKGGIPGWLCHVPPAEIAPLVEKRLEIVERYKGRLAHWDVNNEMLHGDFFRSRCGEQIIPHMFHRAHQVDPGCKLFVNDFNVLCGGDTNSGPYRLRAQVQKLLSQGVPVHGIGCQAHVDRPTPVGVRQRLDVLATTGLPIWLTELDVNQKDENERAERLEVILRESFGHPAVEGIVLWGFMEGFMWTKGGILVRSDGTPNAAGRCMEALLEEWTTKDILGQVGPDGKFVFRGYLGDYEAKVTGADGLVRKGVFTLERNAETVQAVVRLEKVQ